MMTSENSTDSIPQAQTNTNETAPTLINFSSQHEKPLPQTPKVDTSRFSKTLPETTGSNASKGEGNAPRAVRVMDITISPRTPSTKKKGQKNRQGRITSPGLIDVPVTEKPLKHPPIKRRSSSISTFSHTSQKAVALPSQNETVKVYTPPRRNRQSTLTQEQKISYLSLQENDDKENDVPEQNLTLAKAKGTWAGWMKSGQLLRPRLSKDSDVFISDAESKKNDTEYNNILESIRATKNSNPIRNGRHQRNRASTTHSWTTNEDNKSNKANDGPRKIAASHFKSPELEGRSTFGNQRKRASIGAILAPAFEQQKNRTTIQDQDDDDLYIHSASLSSKSNNDRENSKKPLNPKRDLTSIFEKKRRKPTGSPSMNNDIATPAAIQHVKEPISSHPMIQATLAGLGIFGTPPTGLSNPLQDVSSNALAHKQATPSRTHLSPLLGSDLHATPDGNAANKSLPKIIVTPPVPPTRLKGNVDIAQISRAGTYFQAVARESTEKEASVEDHVMASGLPVPDEESSDVKEEQKDTTADVDDEMASLPLEHELPSFEVQEKRMNDDNKGIEGIKLVIDAFLSDFFVERPYDHTKRLFPSLTDLLISSMEPVNHFELSKWGRSQPIPSLRAHCIATEGEEMIILHPRWVQWKLQSTLDIVLDHIITGVIALVVDDRAPYGTPPVMAALIDSLIQNLITPEDIHFNKSLINTEMVRSGQDNALGSWVQMCAMAVGLGGKAKEAFTVADVIQLSTLTADEKDAWKSCLKEIDPAKRLVVLLKRHINIVLERGKATRERNNLLVVPPVQRGSRKRWLAANAEHRARRASHDENFARLTSGKISEGQYRSTERRLAAEGHPRDMFAALHLVRFVGELYKVAVITKYDLRDWLDRFLFDTVFPGVPSMYELEAGCALLLTVGRTIEEQSGKRCSSSSSPEQAQSPSFLRMDPASSPIKPAFDLMKMECDADDELPWSIVEQCIGRLQEIQQIEEVNEEGKVWCREMVAMHQRGWQRAGPSESHMSAVSSAAQAARRARRGPHRNRQQTPQQKQGRSGRSTTTSTVIPTRQSPVQKGESSHSQTDRAQSSSEESKTVVTVQDYEFEDE